MCCPALKAEHCPPELALILLEPVTPFLQMQNILLISDPGWHCSHANMHVVFVEASLQSWGEVKIKCQHTQSAHASQFAYGASLCTN